MYLCQHFLLAVQLIRLSKKLLLISHTLCNRSGKWINYELCLSNKIRLE